ncbi:hypothetical protein Vadar_026307 [Vaccinium darrowii]|uniref:Uncharacterized protein n=1 Tax=Vaccinium darrowii TaxID=229202 RepID=A0ACB7XK32_9ERIC|nr:hypothetical protein Vadar_026307 [Vaccinium darrowii]
MEPRQLKPLIRQVHNFFNDYLKLPVNKNIPVFFVEENQFNRYMPNLPRPMWHSEYFSWKKFIDVSVRMRLPCGHEELGRVCMYKITAQRGWTFKLRNEVEEGICEAVAYKWLKYIAGNYDPSYSENDVAFINNVIENHKHLIKAEEMGSRGAEFLKAKRAIKKYGLKDTLKLVARTRDIPE